MKCHNIDDSIEGCKIYAEIRKIAFKTPKKQQLVDIDGVVLEEKIFFRAVTDRGGDAKITQAFDCDTLKISRNSKCELYDSLVGDSFILQSTNKMPETILKNKSGRHKTNSIIISGHAYSKIKFPVSLPGATFSNAIIE